MSAKKIYILFKYLFYLKHNYTTDWVTCGKHYEEYVKHRNIANSEKRKSRKQHEINIAEKCKTDPKIYWKYVNTSMTVKNGISKLVLGNGNTAETDEQEVVSLNCCMLLKIWVICLITAIHLTLFILTLKNRLIRSHIKDWP